MDVHGVPSPDDFPSEAYAKVSYLLDTWPNPDGEAWEQARGGWLGVGYRFLAAATFDEAWRESLAEGGAAPIPEVRLRQETSLFGFFMAATAVMDCLSYSAFGAAALVRPEAFREMLKSETRKRIWTKDVPGRLRAAFPETALADSLEAALGSEGYCQLDRTRNVLAHRLLPSRQHFVDPVTNRLTRPSEWKLDIRGTETVGMTPAFTAAPRAWLAENLSALTQDLAVFLRALKAESEGSAKSPTPAVPRDEPNGI